VIKIIILPGVLFQPSVTEVFGERQIIIDASHDTVPFSVTVGPSPKVGPGPPPPSAKSATALTSLVRNKKIRRSVNARFYPTSSSSSCYSLAASRVMMSIIYGNLLNAFFGKAINFRIIGEMCR